jgi:hypothetical protein
MSLLDTDCGACGIRRLRSNSIVVEGETECTGEKAWGQFSIFGAIEENLWHGFSRIRTNKKICERLARRRVEGCDLKWCEYLREKLVGDGQRVVHRACTGNAERAVCKS